MSRPQLVMAALYISFWFQFSWKKMFNFISFHLFFLCSQLIVQYWHGMKRDGQFHQTLKKGFYLSSIVSVGSVCRRKPLATVHPIKYAHCFVMLGFVMVVFSVPCGFTWPFDRYLSGLLQWQWGNHTLSLCQWGNPERYYSEPTQTLPKLMGFHRNEHIFWPDFADVKHDYTQEF